jgi:hypothetical protein
VLGRLPDREIRSRRQFAGALRVRKQRAGTLPAQAQISLAETAKTPPGSEALLGSADNGERV